MAEDVDRKSGECVADAVSESGDMEKDPWFLSQLFRFRSLLLARIEEKVLKREQLAAFLENLGKAMNYHGFEFERVPGRLSQYRLMIFGERVASPDDGRVVIFNRDYGRKPERPYDHPRLLLSHFLEGLVEMVKSSDNFPDAIRAYVRSCRDENPHVDYSQFLSQIQFFSLLDEVIFSEEMGARGTVVLLAAAFGKSAFKALYLGQFGGLDEVAEDPLSIGEEDE